MNFKEFTAGCRFIYLIVFVLSFNSCNKQHNKVNYDFDKIPQRVWIGEDFYSVPLEDWHVNNGRVENNGRRQEASLTVLPWTMKGGKGDFRISFDMGILHKGLNEGSAGLLIGSEDPEDPDIRAAVYFGNGIRMGVNTEGYAFFDQDTRKLPQNFSWDSFRLEVTGKQTDSGCLLSFSVMGPDGNRATELTFMAEEAPAGIIQLVNNFRTAKSHDHGPSFWFDNLSIEGSSVSFQKENRFGPILWTMYTLSRNTVKLKAQLPPVAKNDRQKLELQLKKGGIWISAGESAPETDSRCADFRIENYDPSVETAYRVLYPYTDVFGNDQVAEYHGVIAREPLDRPLRMGALTCQFSAGFPYSPLVKNLKRKNPDILYFSGDQIYEPNGGYHIIRSPEDSAILNYLGKWYMFGWAFGDLMRNVPTITTPDDHDVFQGNLWGGGGVRKAPDIIDSNDRTGFAQTTRMVNVVNHTQCSHLPDPYDPTPIGDGMSVWYTSLNYGRISFAIVSDRVFKSGPDLVANWEGRKDHVKAPLKDPSMIEKPGLEFLGSRQEAFLKEWIRDWNNVDMKVLLSQTVFTNAATHHGTWDGYLYGDMDSGGWPKTGRDRAIRIMRKGFAFQIAGDQHLPSIVQYGIDNCRDAGWCFCTPAISIIYSRWFRPDELKIPVRNRPEHGLPNTGEYEDSFGNLNYVYAIGNPGNFHKVAQRYEFEQLKSAGFGFVTFDQKERNITMESWHFLADVEHPGKDDQHPGWPHTISQFDNYGREAVAWLPVLVVEGDPDPVLEVTNETTGELVYMVRIKGNTVMPKVFDHSTYRVRIGYPEKDEWRSFTGLKGAGRTGKEILVKF